MINVNLVSFIHFHESDQTDSINWLTFYAISD